MGTWREVVVSRLGPPVYGPPLPCSPCCSFKKPLYPNTRVATTAGFNPFDMGRELGMFRPCRNDLCRCNQDLFGGGVTYS